MKRLLLVPMFFFTSFAWANHCHELDLTITNQTGSTCVLINSDLKKGHYFESSNAAHEIINHAESAPLKLSQGTLSGPDVQLTYLCGSKRVVLEAAQDICLLVSGHVSGRTLLNDGLDVEVEKQQGSFIWSRHGEVRWTLH